MQVTPSSHVATGSLVAGRYQLGDLLGSGGMAHVYDGMDQRLGRPVAVKLLRPEMAVRDDIRVRFEAEARAAAGLSHPNAVAVFDCGEHEGVAFLVMERLPGETLADRLLDGPVDPGWLCQAAVGVLRALAAAHASGIVHRDVKPGNILLAADGTAKIADFGIAKSLGTEGPSSDLTGTGQLVGTPAYLAPERLEGEPATARSDLFALGVVLYEALAGRKPFDGDSPLAVARAVAEGDHVPLASVRPDLDRQLMATVERALSRDPQDRFASAEEMAAALTHPGLEPTFAAAAATVSADVAGGATVLDDLVAAQGGTMVLPVSPAPGPARAMGPRRTPAWLVLGGLAVLLALLVLARGDRPSVQAAAERAITSTTVAAPPTTALTPTQALAASMRDLASRLTPAQDGAKATDLAAGLRRVADQVDAGTGGPAATGLLISVAQWQQAGLLTPAVTVSTIELLRQVPGVGQTTAVSSAATTPTTAPPAATGSSSADVQRGGDAGGGDGGGGKGKGKGNKKD